MSKILASDGVEIRHRHWCAENPKAILLIIHGMAEHIDRYASFARELNAAGISAVGLELRGHGNGAVRLGWFAQKNGWQAVLDDCFALLNHIREENPSLPLMIYGHSMGTIFARAIIMDIRAERLRISACVLTGVTVDLPVRRHFAPALTKAIGAFTGINKPSAFLAKMTFGAFNNAFKPNSTEYDWLSRDAEQVQRYIDDPLCGFDCTPSLMCDVSTALLHTLKKQNERLILCPVMIAVGESDPVGGTKAAYFLEKRWRAIGKDVEVKVYPGARHELLNETNRSDISADIIGYIARCI